MTNEAFIDRYGFQPTNDDTERASCPGAGTIGHSYCGECEGCGMPKPSCRCAPWKRITNAERWVRTAHKPVPEPKGPATMPQQQKIVEFYFNATPGAVDIAMESDADVFSIRLATDHLDHFRGSDVVLDARIPIERIVISATVNVDNPGPVESRVYWIANSGDLLPMAQFAGWRKKYIGSIHADMSTCHVWEMRDLSTKSLSELFGGGDLNELVRSIEAGDEIDATQYTAEQLGWILSHMAEINEWVEGELRIAELRTSLVASLKK